MNWLQFLLYLSGAYLLYYMVNILTDIALTRSKTADKANVKELTFSETVVPVNVDLPESASETPASPVIAAPVPQPEKKKEPVIISSGGVSIKDIFDVARQEAILFTRSVSF